MKLEDKLDLILDYNNQYKLGDRYYLGSEGILHVIVKHEVLRGPTRSYYTIYRPNPKCYKLSIWWANLRIKLHL